MSWCLSPVATSNRFSCLPEDSDAMQEIDEVPKDRIKGIADPKELPVQEDDREKKVRKAFEKTLSFKKRVGIPEDSVTCEELNSCLEDFKEKGLQRLHVLSDSAKELPEELFTIQSLERLTISCPCLESLSEKIEELVSLKVLILLDCKKLQNLPSVLATSPLFRGIIAKNCFSFMVEEKELWPLIKIKKISKEEIIPSAWKKVCCDSGDEFLKQDVQESLRMFVIRGKLISFVDSSIKSS